MPDECRYRLVLSNCSSLYDIDDNDLETRSSFRCADLPRALKNYSHQISHEYTRLALALRIKIQKSVVVSLYKLNCLNPFLSMETHTLCIFILYIHIYLKQSEISSNYKQVIYRQKFNTLNIYIYGMFQSQVSQNKKVN